MIAVGAAVREAWALQVPSPRPSTRVAISVAGIVLVLGVLTGQTQGGADSPAWALPLDVAVGVAGALSLPSLLRRPLAAALVFTLLSAAFPTATPLAGTALLWLAQHVEVRISVLVGLSGVAAQMVRAVWRPPEAGLFGWWLVAIIAGFAAVVGWGAWSRARRQVMESLVERARRAEEEQAARVVEARRSERTRIAREMHDVLAHRLSLLATFAGAMEYNRQAPPDRLVEAAAVVRAGAHDALEDLRRVIDVLRTEDGAVDDGTAPPQPTLADLAGLVEDSRRAGLPVTLDTGEEELAGVPEALGRTAYRVVQEGLTNARKHAPGEPASVSVRGRSGDSLVVQVRNRLAGAGDDSGLPGAGTGLAGMEERVRLAGGELEAGPVGADEFRIRARLPWPR